MLQLIEKSCDTETSLSKFVVNDVKIQATLEKEGELLQFQEISNILVTSNKPLQHDVPTENVSFTKIPDLYPVKHTITLSPEHFYKTDSNYREYNNSYFYNNNYYFLPLIIIYINIY